jgi:outer membrane protein assembly factor BamB
MWNRLQLFFNNNQQRGEEGEEGSAFELFPDELVLLIFTFLERRDLACAALACKRWNTIASDKRLSLQAQYFLTGRTIFDISRAKEVALPNEIRFRSPNLVGMANPFLAQDGKFGVLYHFHTLWLLDFYSAKLVWRKSDLLSKGLPTALFVSNNRVVVVTEKDVWTLHLLTGEIRGHIAFPGKLKVERAVYDGAKNLVICTDRTKGSLLWYNIQDLSLIAQYSSSPLARNFRLEMSGPGILWGQCKDEEGRSFLKCVNSKNQTLWNIEVRNSPVYKHGLGFGLNGATEGKVTLFGKGNAMFRDEPSVLSIVDLQSGHRVNIKLGDTIKAQGLTLLIESGKQFKGLLFLPELEVATRWITFRGEFYFVDYRGDIVWRCQDFQFQDLTSASIHQAIHAFVIEGTDKLVIALSINTKLNWLLCFDVLTGQVLWEWQEKVLSDPTIVMIQSMNGKILLITQDTKQGKRYHVVHILSDTGETQLVSRQEISDDGTEEVHNRPTIDSESCLLQ